MGVIGSRVDGIICLSPAAAAAKTATTLSKPLCAKSTGKAFLQSSGAQLSADSTLVWVLFWEPLSKALLRSVVLTPLLYYVTIAVTTPCPATVPANIRRTRTMVGGRGWREHKTRGPLQGKSRVGV